MSVPLSRIRVLRQIHGLLFSGVDDELFPQHRRGEYFDVWAVTVDAALELGVERDVHGEEEAAVGLDLELLGVVPEFFASQVGRLLFETRLHARDLAAGVDAEAVPEHFVEIDVAARLEGDARVFRVAHAVERECALIPLALPRSFYRLVIESDRVPK